MVDGIQSSVTHTMGFEYTSGSSASEFRCGCPRTFTVIAHFNSVVVQAGTLDKRTTA